MKKALSLVLAVWMLLILSVSAISAQAVDSDTPTTDSGDIIVGTDAQKIELVGHVQPVILSVVIPSYIPFDISRNLSTENKVVSPQISIDNRSTVPVEILVENADINISQLTGTDWNDTGNVGENEIAVGFTEAVVRPESLLDVRWLSKGRQELQLMELEPGITKTMMVVGDIGSAVPENKSFSVSPTLVVRQK